MKSRSAINSFGGQRLAAINALGEIILDPLAGKKGTMLSLGDAEGEMAAENAALIVEANYQQPLTDYVVGFSEMAEQQAEIEFLAPSVQTGRRFEYATFDNTEAFLSDNSADDLRAPRSDFKAVEYTSGKTQAKTFNRGLKIVLDSDDIANRPNWQEFHARRLTERLLRNKIRRAIALLAAAATNTAKTWDTTALKDPDQDVISELVTSADKLGIKPNRVYYSDTAWAKRLLAHRAQTTAGGFGSSNIRTEAELAGLLGVQGVFHSNSRYSSSTTAKTQSAGAKVLAYVAEPNQSEEDPSHIKGFWSPCDNGQKFAVYVRQCGTKMWELAVEHYEKLAITVSFSGSIRQLTIS